MLGEGCGRWGVGEDSRVDGAPRGLVWGEPGEGWAWQAGPLRMGGAGSQEHRKDTTRSELSL